MKYCLLSLFFLALVFEGYAQTVQFRTDGYYFYDNKCDTLFLMDTKDKQHADLIKMISNAGFVIDDSVSCAPRHSIPLGGSSQIKILAFFSGKVGAYFNSACWDERAHKAAMKKFQQLRIRNQKKIRGGEFLIVNKLYNNNTSVIDEKNLNEHTAKVLTGTLYKDSIVVTEHYFIPGFDRKKRMTFRFYRLTRSRPREIS
jgi:hypothetical protein